MFYAFLFSDIETALTSLEHAFRVTECRLGMFVIIEMFL